jgi:glycosyltransferase involved in cell wall biosynthesis
MRGKPQSLMKRAPIFWFLCGDQNVASSRLQGYIVHRYLKSRGFKSILFSAPATLTRDLLIYENEQPMLADFVSNGIVVLQKIKGSHASNFIREINKREIQSIYISCDYEPENSIPLECSYVVSPVKALVDYYSQRGKQAIYIPDPVECTVDRSELVSNNDPSILKLVWVGEAGNWGSLEELKGILSSPGMEKYSLVTVSNHPQADHRWNRKTVYDIIKGCDIGVIPIDKNSKRASYKSNNRITLFMALGKPVMAGNIPSYRDTIVNGENGYLCLTREDWIKGLKALETKEKRDQVAIRAYDQLGNAYIIPEVGQKWEEFFNDINSLEKRSRVPASNEVRLATATIYVKNIVRLARRVWQKSRKLEVMQYVIRRMVGIFRVLI